ADLRLGRVDAEEELHCRADWRRGLNPRGQGWARLMVTDYRARTEARQVRESADDRSARRRSRAACRPVGRNQGQAREGVVPAIPIECRDRVGERALVVVLQGQIDLDSPRLLEIVVGR